MCLVFALITFVLHTVTDYFTSRITSKFFNPVDGEDPDFHNGFVVIGFDQVLHHLQLWFTYLFVIQIFR